MTCDAEIHFATNLINHCEKHHAEEIGKSNIIINIDDNEKREHTHIMEKLGTA